MDDATPATATLPAPPVLRAALAGLPAWTAPGAGVEARLAAFFADALNLDTVGADDDFFALGGTSHQAATIFACIHAELGHRLPLATLYRSPTVRLLARAIGKAAAKAAAPATADAPAPPADSLADDCVPVLQAGTSALPLFIAPGIGGDVAGFAHLLRALDPGQTVFGLRSVGLADGEEPLTSVPLIAARFIEGMHRVHPAGGQGGAGWQLLGVCWGGVVMLEIARQLADAGEEVRLLALLDPPPVGAIATPAAAATAKGPRATAEPSPLAFLGRRFGLYRRTLAALPLRAWPGYVAGRLANLIDGLRRRDPLRGDPAEYLRWRVSEANRAALRACRPPAWPPDRAARACLIFTAGRGESASRAARAFWTRHLHAGGREETVPGRDSGDALTAENAGAVARVLASRLA